MIYFNNEMKKADQLCKKLGITGHKIFIDSNGSVALSFKTAQHRDKYVLAESAYYQALGYTTTINTDEASPLADWEQNLCNEMLATRQ